MSKYADSNCKYCDGGGFLEEQELCQCVEDTVYQWLDENNMNHDAQESKYADSDCKCCLGEGVFSDRKVGIFEAYCECINIDSAYSDMERENW